MRGTTHCPIRKAAKVCTTASSILTIVIATLILANTGVVAAVEQTFKAQRNTRECLDVLGGKVRMIDPDNEEVAEVNWIKLKPMEE